MPKAIVYSLSNHPVLHCYIPSPFVCNIDKAGALGTMLKKATPEVIASFQSLEYNEVNQRCLRICEDLSDEGLQNRFIKTKRSSINKLLADDKTAKPIQAAIDKQVNEILELISKHKLPLCLDIKRKTKLEKLRILCDEVALSPILKFVKTPTGIEYTLGLESDDQSIWHPADMDAQMICNQPGWVILDKKLFRLQHINGNKLKPFLKKKSVIIPDHLSHTYLEKFVYHLIAKVKVELNGFELIQHTESPKAILKAREDFISDSWILDLLFTYGSETFHYWAKEDKRTRLHYEKDNSISFSMTKRQESAEEAIIALLKQYGITVDKTKRLVFADAPQDPFHALNWLRINKDSIESHHISIELPKINDHTLSFDEPDIALSQIEDNDWFDVKAVISIGNQQVPFHELISYIKNNNRVFEMENGEAFIIPLEWMSQYASLARWAKVEDKKVSILKSQYGLLQEESSTDDDSMRIYAVAPENVEFTISPLLKTTLRPYQHAGVQWLINHQHNGLGCCLADDMGLGKTIQTIAAILHAFENQSEKQNESENQNQSENQNEKQNQNGTLEVDNLSVTIIPTQLDLFGEAFAEPVVQKVLKTKTRKERAEKSRAPRQSIGQARSSLIIMPSSLLFNWKSEIKKFAPHLFVKQHIGPQRATSIESLITHDIILTSYQTALRDIDLLAGIEWQYVVLDESQYIKNQASKIFSAIQQLPANHKLSLSGTPIENSLSDLWSQMQFINPDILGSYSFFKKHFQKPIEKDKDESLIDELKSLTRPFLLRRTKEEVLTDLPDKTEQIIYCEMSKEQAAAYETEKSSTRNLILQSDLSDPQVKMQVLSSLLRLRQLANHPILYKSDYAEESGKFEIIKESLEKVRKSGQKALVFSSFTKHLDLVGNFLDSSQIPFVSITGKTSQKNRQKAVRAFQDNSEIPFFLISIKAGGTGLNLTAANYVLILDPWWNPFVEEQAIARAHRIGLQHSLSVLKLISKDSIEEKILKLQQKKLNLSKEFIDAGDKMNWTKEELGYLLT